MHAGTLENRRQPGRPYRFPPHGGTCEGFPFQDRAAELFHQAEQDFPEEEGKGGWVSVCALDRDFLEGLSISGSRGSYAEGTLRHTDHSGMGWVGRFGRGYI